MAANIRKRLTSLLGVSAYESPTNQRENEAALERARSSNNGVLARPTTAQTRFYERDLEDAVVSADGGDLRQAARLWRAMRRDGVVAGLLAQCTDGLVRLPKQYSGDAAQCDRLREVFDSMLPAAELALIAADGRGLGVGLGELVPVKGREHPVLVRLEPEFLHYRWDLNRWYYSSNSGELEVNPGDGHWVLHVPGGRVSPWQHGTWLALGRPWIHKDHAIAYKANWESKLANPARVAYSPSAATEEQQEAWFQRVLAWGVNTVFGLRPGYDVKLLESNGRGYESFAQTIKDCNEEIIITLAGQIVTTTGGSGFVNGDMYKSIRSDIIKSIADSLAHTINTQVLSVWAYNLGGPLGLVDYAKVAWDVTPPKDRLADANAIVQLASAIKQMRDALAPYRRDIDIDAILGAQGVRTVAVAPTVQAVTTRLELAPTDIAKVVRVNEARQAQGLPPLDDDRGVMMLTELDKQPASEVAP